MPVPAKRKPRRNKQHAAKGASFLRFGKHLRELATSTTYSLAPGDVEILNAVADAAEATGKETRKLR